MQLRAFVISVVIALLAVQSSASTTVSWQSNPKGDVISGEWAAVINRPSRNVPITFKLKLEGDKVTGVYESSHLGNGTLSNGSWVNNKLKITIQSSHGALVLTATLQNDNLAGEWEAKKEARDDKRNGGDERE
jgi:cellulase/cellobiase CelA1